VEVSTPHAAVDAASRVWLLQLPHYVRARTLERIKPCHVLQLDQSTASNCRVALTQWDCSVACQLNVKGSDNGGITGTCIDDEGGLPLSSW
jgi:hypothetical protein